MPALRNSVVPSVEDPLPHKDQTSQNQQPGQKEIKK